MILDYDRNDMFLAGLKTVISEKKAKGQEAIVLDIGMVSLIFFYVV